MHVALNSRRHPYRHHYRTFAANIENDKRSAPVFIMLGKLLSISACLERAERPAAEIELHGSKVLGLRDRSTAAMRCRATQQTQCLF